MQYDLEIEKIIEEITKNDYKKVLIQLADGLKPQAKEIVDNIRKETNAEVLIWLGSCYGACDTPFVECDLVVQFGHNLFKKQEGW